MKKNHLLTNVFIGGSLCCLLLTSCTKDAVVPPSQTTANRTAETTRTTSDAISTAISPTGVLGTYLVRDSKTIFIGQANSTGSNEFIHLDYIDVPKKLLATADKKHLTMPYGPSNYVDSGWAYIIDYNVATKAITLTPNAAMIADIVPGSFETLFTFYDPKGKSGTFVTRFTALSDRGNETEISENFFKN